MSLLLYSSGTLTDVSSMHSDYDGLSKSKSDDGVLDRYEEINDMNDDLDFKMPDLGLGVCTTICMKFVSLSIRSSLCICAVYCNGCKLISGWP